MTSTASPIMPVFVFIRHRDIELENGFALAGTLIVDIPKTKTPKRRQQRMIADILRQLYAGAGQMSDDALLCGWPKNERPANADAIINNNELMANWMKTRIAIAVRSDPRNDGMVRIDSVLARQVGLIKQH
jgi:hypothetical protein